MLRGSLRLPLIRFSNIDIELNFVILHEEVSMKNYCITGGAGFIGSHLAGFLLARGERVTVVDNFCDFYPLSYKIQNVLRTLNRETSKIDTLEDLIEETGKNESYSLILADIRDEKSIESLFTREKFDAVIHLAAMAGVRPSLADPRLYEDVNIAGTLNILDVCRKKGIGKLVIASSSSVYGNTKEVPFREDMPVDHPISPYAATKKATELFASVYHNIYHMDIALLRYFTVYGPGQRPDLAIHKFTRALFEEKEIPFFGDGTMKRDYTYIDDIIQGTVLALEWVERNSKVCEVINLGESRTVSLQELVELLAQKTGKEPRLRREPQPPGDVDCTYADLNKARKLLGYAPGISIEEGLDRFVRWCRDFYHY